jgi:hypothetical protein
MRRGVVALAFDNQVIKFEIWLGSKDTERLLREALRIARSFRFSSRENLQELHVTLGKIRQSVQSRPTATTTGGGNIGSPLPNPNGSNGPLQPGAPANVQGGQGELEVAATNDGTGIVLASNAALSFSTNSGASFSGGSTGVFGLNDPSVSRAVSGDFYLGVIASPTGTAAQLNIAGCTNAVSQSTNGGSSFGLQGFSTVCPESGNGMCFPDQPHVTGDAFNAAPSAAPSDQLYAVWRNFTAVWPSQPSDCHNIFESFDSTTASIACSQNSGTTWTAPAAIPGAGDFPRVSVGMDGKVYVTSLSGNGVLLNRFTSCASGLTPDSGFPVTVDNLNGTVACPVPGLDRCNDGNALSSPMVAPDPLNAQHLFVSYAENDGNGGERVVVAESNDEGMTFPNRNTVSAPTSARRFMPWSCSTLGTVVVGWYDRGAANASGATNDLTDYVLGGPAVSGVTNLSNNPDPQCASGWPCQARSQNDSKSCTVQPQEAGICLNGSGGGSKKACDFLPGSCPSGEGCNTGSGCPKYGDYNGIACANGSAIAAWTSATVPAGLPAVSGLNVFSSVVSQKKVTGPTPTFDKVSITMTTGGDNADSGVEITGTLSGQKTSFCLKPSTSLAPDNVCSNGPGAVDQDNQNSWGNGNVTTQTFPLDTPQASVSGFGSFFITMLQSGCQTFCSNWNIQGISVTAMDSTGTLPATPLLNILNNGNSNCLARLKAPPNANVVLFGLNGTGTHIYLDGTSSEKGETTNCNNNGG